MMIDVFHKPLMALLLQFLAPQCQKMWNRCDSQSTQLYWFFLLFKDEFWRTDFFHLLKQRKNSVTIIIIFLQNDESLGDNVVTRIDVQFNSDIITMAVKREHEFEMMVICCTFFPWLWIGYLSRFWAYLGK